MKRKYAAGMLYTQVVLILTVLFLLTMTSCHKVKPKNIIQYDKDLTIVMNGGGNSGILVGDSVVVVIDTKMPDHAGDFYKMVMEKAGTKPVVVINTHYHKDHTGGNHLFKGDKIYMGNYDTTFLHKNLKPEDMPTDFINDSLVMNLGYETIVIYNLGQAHTYDDVVVYLRKSKVLFSGDLLFNKINPVLKGEGGADVNKWMDLLHMIMTRWDTKTIVPGHGPLGNTEMAQNLINYFSDMKDAAHHPDKENELKSKYKDWMKMPTMASPEKTIEFIRQKEKQ